MIEQIGHDDNNEDELYLINNWVAGLTSPRLVVAALKALTLLTKGKLKAAKVA